MEYIILRSFTRKFDSYNRPQQEVITQTLDEIKNYLETNQAPAGLGIRKLSGKIYEGRINIHLRIAYFREGSLIKFFCLGNHDDVKRCLKSFR